MLQIILKREHEIGNNYLSLKLKSFVVKVRPLRVLRQYAFSRAFGRLDAASKYPMVIRMIKTINIMVILMHVLGTAPIYMLQFSCHLTASTSSCLRELNILLQIKLAPYLKQSWRYFVSRKWLAVIRFIELLLQLH